MRQQKITLLLVFLYVLLSAGILWGNAYVRYQKYTAGSPLSGTILTWKFGKTGDNLILLNPNDVEDYVEFDFDFLKKGVRAYIGSIFFDGTGFYVLVGESFETEKGNLEIKKNLFYLSSAGILPMAKDLNHMNGEFSGFIKSENTLFLKLNQSLYKIDERTKNFWKIKDFNTKYVYPYPYQDGIVYQSGDEIRFYSESGDTILAHLPDNMRFDGWCEVGKSVFVHVLPHRETYVMDLVTGTLNLFSKFTFSNSGNSHNCVLLMPFPQGGGGATPLDVEYTWSCLLGNDVFLAFVYSIYNIDTKKIKNIYIADILKSLWLDVPYDRDRFETIKQEIMKMQEGGVTML